MTKIKYCAHLQKFGSSNTVREGIYFYRHLELVNVVARVDGMMSNRLQTRNEKCFLNLKTQEKVLQVVHLPQEESVTSHLDILGPFVCFVHKKHTEL